MQCVLVKLFFSYTYKGSLNFLKSCKFHFYILENKKILFFVIQEKMIKFEVTLKFQKTF